MGEAVLREGWGAEYGYREVIERARGGLDTPRHRVAAAAHYLSRAKAATQELILAVNPPYMELEKLLGRLVLYAEKRAQMIAYINEK